MSEEKETVLEFDIVPVRIPVRIDGAGYVLTKASASAAAEWRKGLVKSATMAEDGSVKSLGEGVADLDFPLLASCLHHAVLDDDGKVVEVKELLSVGEVRALPNDAVGPLAERVKEISAMKVQQSKKALLKQLETLQREIAEVDERADPLGG